MQRPMTLPSSTSRAANSVVVPWRLFVDREDDGMGGRVDIEPDNIAQLVDELRVGGELELPDSVRLQTMRAPDPLHRACADADSFRHHRGSPMGRLNRISPSELYD